MIKKEQLPDFLSLCITLSAALLITSMLGLAGFERVFASSLVRKYEIYGETLKNNIEVSLNMGKKLYLLEDQLKVLCGESLSAAEGITAYYITDAQNTVVYTTSDSGTAAVIPLAAQQAAISAADGRTKPAEFGEFLLCRLPLYSDKQALHGFLYIEFPRDQIVRAISSLRSFNLCAAAGLLLIALFFYIAGMRRQSAGGRKWYSLAILFAVQGIFCFVTYRNYNTAVTDVFIQNVSVLEQSVAADFRRLLDTGIDMSVVGDIQSYLERRIAANPECISIIPHIGAADISVDAEINTVMIQTILRELALDTGTIMLVSLIISFILKDVITVVSGRWTGAESLHPVRVSDPESLLKIIKISTFLFIFAAFGPLSFMPVFIQNTADSYPGFLQFLSLPVRTTAAVSAYMAGTMAAMLVLLFMFKSVSLKKKYICVSVVFITGFILTSAASGSLPGVICARFLTGAGFGGILMNTTSFIMTYVPASHRSRGFSCNAVGFAAASLCAVPVGGIISDKFGYTAGILIAVISAVLFLCFMQFVFCELRKTDVHESGRIGKTAFSVRNFFNTVWSRHIFVYTVCINIPFQLIYVGLLQYFLPLYMQNELHFAANTAGRILTVFSIASLFAVFINRIGTKINNNKLLIALGGVCASCVLILFNQFDYGAVVLLVCLLFAMGIHNVCIDAFEEIYISSGCIAGVSGETVLQVYKTLEKCISVLIPSVSAMLISALGFTHGLTVIGVCTLAGALGFIVWGKNGTIKDV